MASHDRCHYDERMGFFYNNSNITSTEWDQTQLILVQCVGSICCGFILVANALVITAVVTNRRFHYPFYYLLSNLAASDFLAGIAYVYLMFNTGKVSHELSVQVYFFRQGLLDISLSASLANLLVIALERYISVMNWKIHSNLTKRRVTLLIILVWAISIFMGTVPRLGWNCICSLDLCSKLAPLFSRSYLIFWSVSNLVLFLIMVCIYLRIYIYVMRKTVVLSAHTSGSMNRKRTPIKLIKTVMTVLGKYCLYYKTFPLFLFNWVDLSMDFVQYKANFSTKSILTKYSKSVFCTNMLNPTHIPGCDMYLSTPQSKFNGNYRIRCFIVFPQSTITLMSCSKSTPYSLNKIKDFCRFSSQKESPHKVSFLAKLV